MSRLLTAKPVKQGNSARTFFLAIIITHYCGFVAQLYCGPWSCGRTRNLFGYKGNWPKWFGHKVTVASWFTVKLYN